MSPTLPRWRAWLWWLIPFAALALLLGIETDWGRGIHRLPGPAPVIEPKPVAAALLPEYRLEGGLGAHTETVDRTLFNPTRRPAPALAADGARTSMPKGRFVLTGTAVAGDRHIAFLKEVASGKSRAVRQGEQVNGVLVATVTADRVRFTQGDDSEELILKVAVGPKTTTPPPLPAPPVAPAPQAPEGGAILPGAVPPVTPGPTEPVPVPARRAAGARRAGNLPAQVPVSPAEAASPAPAGTPAPAAASTPAPAAASGTAASPDPAWNDVFERMRQRNAPAPAAK